MKAVILNALIILSFCAMTAGCYTESIATRRLEKAHSLYPATVAKYCGEMYPSIDATTDSMVFMPGESITIDDTLLVHDTLNNISVKYIKELRYKTDTLYRLRTVRLVNRANEKYLAGVNQKTTIALAKAQKVNNIIIWVAALLGIYTIGRWVLRVWGIKLP